MERRDKMARLTLSDGRFSDGWILDPFPRRTGEGVFDTTLRISAIRVTNQRVEMFKNTHDMQSVSISFTQDKNLKVVGGKTTFEGDLTTVNDKLLAQVQAGIKEAFAKPETTSDLELLSASNVSNLLL